MSYEYHTSFTLHSLSSPLLSSLHLSSLFPSLFLSSPVLSSFLLSLPTSPLLLFLSSLLLSEITSWRQTETPGQSRAASDTMVETIWLELHSACPETEPETETGKARQGKVTAATAPLCRETKPSPTHTPAGTIQLSSPCTGASAPDNAMQEHGPAFQWWLQ